MSTSSSSVNANGSASGATGPSLRQSLLHRLRVVAVEAEAFGVGDHVGQGLLGAAALPVPVLQHVDQPQPAVPAGLLERNPPGVQQPDQCHPRDT